MKTIKLLLLSIFLFCPILVQAMPPGTLLYRTSRDGQMYGYSTDELINVEKGIIKGIFPGHVGIYIGQEDGVDYVVEALADGIVKVPAEYFVNLSEGEELLGARLPEDLSPVQRAKAVMLAKNLAEAGLKYDFDFKKQKGPNSGEWTCVGLTEKIYESANVSNPNNLGSLEYDSSYYAVDITEDGFDNINIIDSEGNCFSETLEFSKIAKQKDTLFPAPELIGFNAGLEYDGERYIFLPYTQFLQPSLKDVEINIQVASHFTDQEIRGKFSRAGLILRWSLINNPISSSRKIVSNVKSFAVKWKEKIFSDKDKTELVINEDKFKKAKKKTTKKTTKKKVVEKKPSQARVQITKRTKTEAVKPEKEEKLEEIIETKEEVVQTEEEVLFNNQVEGLEIEFIAEEEIEVAMAVDEILPEPNISVNRQVVVSETVDTSVSTPSNSSAQSGTGTASSGSGSSTNSSADSSSTVTETVVETEAEEEIDENNDWPKLALISKIYSTANNDWIELYNPGDKDFDLAEAGYRLEKAKTAEDPSLAIRIGNTDDASYPGGTIIKANDYYRIVRDDAEDEYRNKADAIANRKEFAWFDSGYTLYLGTAAISSSTDVDVIDAVGFGADATYFAGSGPAPAITDYYILDRIATTSDNSVDYELLATDKVIIATTTPEEVNNIVASSTVGLISIESDNISQLYHFDECYGAGKWAVGKWGCARESGYIYDPITISLDPVVDTNNFSVSFYYRKSRENSPSISFRMTNSDNEYLEFSLDSGLIEFKGLPNTDWRYYTDLSITDTWEQAMLVVNRDNNYWSLYINGEEVYNREFDEDLLVMDNIEIYGETESFLLDELVIWDRPLLFDEVLSNYNADLPYYPLDVVEPQTPAELLYSWDFNQCDEEMTSDSISGLELNLKPNFWINEGVEGRGMKSVWGEDIEVALSNMIDSKDLSLSFWWRNSSYPKESRIKVSLRSNEKDRLALMPNYYRPTFWFNDNYGAISEGVGLTIPHDDLWHHLVLTYNSYDYLLQFYVDGEIMFSHPFIWIEEGNDPNSLMIKAESDSSEIDELSAWRGVLVPDKIKELYELYK